MEKPHRSRYRSQIVIVVAFALAVAACGAGESGSDTSAPVATALEATTTETPATTTLAAVTSTTATPTTTATTVAPTTTTMTPTTTTLPGEPIDAPPRRGDIVAVVGVAHDDVLNVRAAPGIDQTIVTTLDPLEDTVLVLGNARLLPNSIWTQVEFEGLTGWASIAFLGYLGETDDITAQLVADLGEIPTAETMIDLGLIAAEAVASVEPPSRIVMSVAPSVGDLGEVTYDVIGLGDDSLYGFRLHVFGMPDEGGEGFVLKSVERTLICGRGLSGSICV